MPKRFTDVLTVALHHAAARQVRLQTASQGSYSRILAGPLSCKHLAMCLTLCIQLVSLNSFMKS